MLISIIVGQGTVENHVGQATITENLTVETVPLIIILYHFSRIFSLFFY